MTFWNIFYFSQNIELIIVCPSQLSCSKLTKSVWATLCNKNFKQCIKAPDKREYSKCLKFWTLYSNFFWRNFCFLCSCFLKILSRMANSIDPDQTAPSGAVWSGSTLFAYAILSDTLVYKILGYLSYPIKNFSYFSTKTWCGTRKCLGKAFLTSTHNMFSWRNKTNVSTFWLKKHLIWVALHSTVSCMSDFRYRGHKFESQLYYITFLEIDHEKISMVILTLQLIQEGRLSVTGKSMCTSTGNPLLRLDQACPGKVRIG